MAQECVELVLVILYFARLVDRRAGFDRFFEENVIQSSSEGQYRERSRYSDGKDRISWDDVKPNVSVLGQCLKMFDLPSHYSRVLSFAGAASEWGLIDNVCFLGWLYTAAKTILAFISEVNDLLDTLGSIAWVSDSATDCQLRSRCDAGLVCPCFRRRFSGLLLGDPNPRSGGVLTESRSTAGQCAHGSLCCITLTGHDNTFRYLARVTRRFFTQSIEPPGSRRG